MTRRTRKITSPDVATDTVVAQAAPATDAASVDPRPAQVRPKPGSKLAVVLGLLSASEGASLTRLVEVTGWLPHTTRAALTGLRKRGFAISRERADADGAESVYRVAAVEAA